MPWFPDFVSAVELVRQQDRDRGRADPVGQYFSALNRGDPHVLESAWPGRVVVYDPKAGEVRGHQALRHFVHQNKAWLAGLGARTETVAATQAGGRAVVEILAHLTVRGQPVAWPIAVVAEMPDELSVVFRTYCSQWPVDGRRPVRPPVLSPEPCPLPDVVGSFQAALTKGDLEAVLATFDPGGYYREPIGPHAVHRGPSELRSFFTRTFSDGGGIGLQDCAVTDDGVRCALEYNCVRWGQHDLPPQAGLSVCERDPGGQLAAVRVYDDVTPPADLT
ncbi:MAG: nuclear transport factor 2 family protein [Actinobacteria bacterium]|nr:nuclear transport factor 2 family protein [Actinomycetota bacterium]